MADNSTRQVRLHLETEHWKMWSYKFLQLQRFELVKNIHLGEPPAGVEWIPKDVIDLIPMQHSHPLAPGIRTGSLSKLLFSWLLVNDQPAQ